jgi:hypothetical protein
MLLYIGALLFSTLIIIKPGASLFYIKKTVDTNLVVFDTGHAFRYKLKLNPLIYRFQELLIYEGKRALTPASGGFVIDQGVGSYSLSTSSNGEMYIYFS